MKKLLSALLALSAAAALLVPAAGAAAPVQYLPDVTPEMAEPSFWAALEAEPDRLLADAAGIAAVNAAALATEDCNMYDLRNLPDTFNGVERCAALRRSVASDADYYVGWTYAADGKKTTDAFFAPMLKNCDDPNASEEMPVRWGIAVNRALLITFPSERRLLSSPSDTDFDYQALVGIRVNEPVAIYTTSADGKFYQVVTSCCSGWVRTEDIAICADREEWLSAWDIPADRRLVFYGDRMYTEYSNTSASTSNRLLTMGTVLERLDSLASGALVTNRLPLHNYAVYLPIRDEAGRYAKIPALVNAREKVSEDYLPLTARNIAMVAFNSLGNVYGWGAGLNNEDCTSYVRNIYSCFGLDLPRNGNWQWPLSIPKLDVGYMGEAEKAALLDQMPLGTIVSFPGHQMMYLGKYGGKYYVINAVSSIIAPWNGKGQRTRDVQLNTLEMTRNSGRTWLREINRIYYPWVFLADGAESPMPAMPWYHEGVAYCVNKKLIDSFEDGFRPNEEASRALIAEALWRSAGSPEPKGTESFPDVKSGASYAKAAVWAREQGIIDGIDGRFKPEQSVTREMLATMFYRFAKAEGGKGTAELDAFADRDSVSDWAREPLAWAVRSGLITGRTRRSVAPQGTLTRAELAVILMRFRQL